MAFFPFWEWRQPDAVVMSSLWLCWFTLEGLDGAISLARFPSLLIFIPIIATTAATLTIRLFILVLMMMLTLATPPVKWR